MSFRAAPTLQIMPASATMGTFDRAAFYMTAVTLFEVHESTNDTEKVMKELVHWAAKKASVLQKVFS